MMADIRGHKETAKILRKAGRCNSSRGNQRETHYIVTSKIDFQEEDDGDH